jgi:hypothetical protein
MFMAASFSDRNGCSSECSCRFATSWNPPRTWWVLGGSCARANDVAATDAVVASEITRLRIKARENKIISTSEHSELFHGSFLGLPLWKSRPNETSRQTERGPGFAENMTAKRHALN